MCINPNPNANPNLTFGFTHIFEEVQRNIQTWRQVTGMFFKAIMHYVCRECLVWWYHCNFQVINCRMIYNLLTLLVFIWMRCETALAPKMCPQVAESNHVNEFNYGVVSLSYCCVNLSCRQAIQETFLNIAGLIRALYFCKCK